MSELLTVNIGDLTLKNPIMPASGTFEIDLSQFIDFNELGAFVTKTFTQDRRSGNPVPRVCEIEAGMINSIGIPSKGVDYYLEQIVPFYRNYDAPLITSISADTAEQFAELAKRLSDVEGIDALEVNISCPNLEAHGKAFAVSAESTAKVMRALRQATHLPLYAKLTPNTSEIMAVAKAVENEGGDAIVMGNTVLGMAIDIRTRKPKLGKMMGGLSGPVVKPINLRMTYQCYKSVNIPIIGCGGISTAEDVIEYFLAGATAVQVGTANFIHPHAMTTIIQNIQKYCEENQIRIAELTGQLDDSEPQPFTALT